MINAINCALRDGIVTQPFRNTHWTCTAPYIPLSTAELTRELCTCVIYLFM